MLGANNSSHLLGVTLSPVLRCHVWASITSHVPREHPATPCIDHVTAWEADGPGSVTHRLKTSGQKQGVSHFYPGIRDGGHLGFRRANGAGLLSVTQQGLPGETLVFTRRIL